MNSKMQSIKERKKKINITRQSLFKKLRVYKNLIIQEFLIVIFCITTLNSLSQLRRNGIFHFQCMWPSPSDLEVYRET